ncbi:MAG: nucleotide exchange factor GrpE [Actinobacteria bacterium]|nr:nucleotide exchange factor GrpE [Actinomycetota bacterium]
MSDNDQGVNQAEGVKITDKRKLDPETGAPRISSDAQEAPVSDLEDASDPVVELDPVAELTADLERDRETTRDLVVSNTLAELLPVIDDIGRARTHGELEGAFKSVGEALESTVTRLGLKPFGAPGDEFDPTKHEAISHEFSADVSTSTCVNVFQPGYEFNGKIIRAAIVSVADPETVNAE